MGVRLIRVGSGWFRGVFFIFDLWEANTLVIWL